MKSKTYIIVAISLLMLVLGESRLWACAYNSYEPSEYDFYRIYFPGRNTLSNKQQNCMLWKELTSMNIPESDIMQVVYEWDVKTFNALLKTQGLTTNVFAHWLLETQNKDAFELLKLAKQCETIRAYSNSPWYYAYDGDDVQTTLREIADNALKYESGRLLDRYMLQAVRALFTLKEYDKCIQIWNNKKVFLPDGLIKSMTESYVAGSYYHIGNEQKALELYAECGDYYHFYFKYMKDKNAWIEGIRNSVKQFPDVLWYDEVLQREVLNIDRYYDYDIIGDEQMNENRKDCMEKYSELFGLAQEILKYKNNPHADIWYYTGAYMAEKLGNMNTSLDFIQKAEHICKDDSLRASIHVFKTYLLAQMMPVNAQYDQWLYQTLSWYERQIKNNMTDDVLNYCLEWDNWGGHEYSNSAFSYMNGCYSFYYWNDMLRKLLISVVAPKYLDAGRGERAIQLVNMADNMLIKVVENSGRQADYSMEAYRSNTKQFNHFDYCNHLFALLDTIPISAIINYTNKVVHPQNQMDQLINRYSYTDLNYFNEIIGTRYLRSLKYHQAVAYLEKVPSSFQYRLNTCKDGYLVRNPFEQEHKMSDNSDYKLKFAKEMAMLEEGIKHTKDPNRKAQQMIRYALGIRNSFDKCWALSYYGKSMYWVEVDGDYTQKSGIYDESVEERYQQLTQQALSLFTDNEAAAKAYWLLGYYKKVVRDYPDTEMADFAINHCDRLADYVGKKK